jgi:hypothetical protein
MQTAAELAERLIECEREVVSVPGQRDVDEPTPGGEPAELRRQLPEEIQQRLAVLDEIEETLVSAGLNLEPPPTAETPVSPPGLPPSPPPNPPPPDLPLPTGTDSPPVKPPEKPSDTKVEDLQFTAYRPDRIHPGTWYTLLAFAHLREKPLDADPREPEPIERVKQLAEAHLAGEPARYDSRTADSLDALPRGGEITFVPKVSGIEFNPPRQTFRWLEAVHKVEFRLRADGRLVGRTARGRLSAFWGVILLADIPLAIGVEGGANTDVPLPLPAPARMYHSIFASYSREDTSIVAQIEECVQSLGHRYLRDTRDLRAGEVWSERLTQLIDQSDIFQLFWSHNSMRSPFVRREWEYALALARPGFVRPTYWEDPFPQAPEAGLPPENLRRLHFQRLPHAIAVSSGATSAVGQSPGSTPSSEHDTDTHATPAVARVRQPVSGTETFGKFRLQRALGTGGVGTVYLANQMDFDRPVELMVLSPNAAADPKLVQRFLQTVRRMVALEHPNIVRGYTAGVQEGIPYFAREFIDGESAKELLARLGPLEVGDALRIVIEVARALAYGETKEMVHRDINPSNVMITCDGAVKVADFGIARATHDDADLAEGDVSALPGNLNYAAPEQLLGWREVDGRCDIYALGGVLYRLLTGRNPFSGNVAVVLNAKMEGRRDPARHINPKVPEILDRVIDKMMAHDPKDRFQTATEVIRALEATGLAHSRLTFLDRRPA